MISFLVAVILLSTMFTHIVEAESQQDSPTEDDGIEQKVLIIGIDGVRGDVAETIAQRNDSTFGRLKEEGAWSFNMSVGPYAISGPGWSSMLTGVWCDRHGVVDNSFFGSKLSSVPDLFEHLESNDPNLRTAAVYWWEPIGEDILSENSIDVMEHFENDGLVRDRAVELLNTDPELDVLFVSIDNPDAVGHDHGFSPDVPEYVAAVEAADNMARDIISALEQRNLSGEDWVTIITSDHGGGGRFLKSHHASESIDQRTFMLVTGGATVAGEMTNDPVVVDVTATALTHLEVPLPEGDLALDGRASAFDPSAAPAREPVCRDPLFFYQVDLMIGIGLGLLFVAVASFFLLQKKRRSNQEHKVSPEPPVAE